MVDRWVSLFVENELYDQDDYHRFCKRVKGLTTLEIQRVYKQEMRN